MGAPIYVHTSATLFLADESRQIRDLPTLRLHNLDQFLDRLTLLLDLIRHQISLIGYVDNFLLNMLRQFHHFIIFLEKQIVKIIFVLFEILELQDCIDIF